MKTPLAVLIVEDSDSDAKLIVRTLSRADYEITSQVVETAAQMRAALKQRAWDIIISDYSLPKFSGHAALLLVQEVMINVPFIVVSGVIGEEAAVAMMKGGAHDYVMKDNLARLVPAVERELRDANTRRARTHAEDALWKEKWRLESIIEGTHVGTWEWNVQSGAMVINEIWAEMVGQSIEELAPMNFDKWEAIIHPDDRTKSAELLKRHFAGELLYCEYECRLKHKAGHYVWVHYRGCVSIRTDAGKPLIMFGTQIDITNRKRVEERLQKMQMLQSVGVLAGVMAHDFNDILMAVFGNIALAKDEFPKGHSGRSLLESAEKSMNRAVILTRRLLAFAKGGVPIKEEVNVGMLAEEVVQLDLVGSGVTSAVKKNEDLWRVDADKSQIQQVISNLVINAREAMPEGGCVNVTLENAEIKEGAVPDLSPGKYVKVCVRDEGIGMNPKTLDRVFEPYFTTKQAGSGLGLATAYSIINGHAGHIGIVSKPGKGTSVTFYLPAAQAVQREETKATAMPTHRSGTVKILVMDDQEEIRTLVAKMLMQCGFTVEAASDGHKAVEMYTQARDAGKSFDVVIVDLTMPGGFGAKEVLKSLQAIDPGVKGIVSSGYTDNPVMIDYTQHGFKGFVAKPYTKNELSTVVNRVING